MKKNFLIFTFLFLFCGLLAVNAQTVPPYKISSIKALPFDAMTGEFKDALTNDDAFLNELDMSVLVIVEISGKSETISNRKIQVTVMEGTKQKAKKLGLIGVLNANGKYFFPVWLDAPLCDEIKITAQIVGQKTPSTMTSKATFDCGE